MLGALLTLAFLISPPAMGVSDRYGGVHKNTEGRSIRWMVGDLSPILRRNRTAHCDGSPIQRVGDRGIVESNNKKIGISSAVYFSVRNVSHVECRSISEVSLWKYDNIALRKATTLQPHNLRNNPFHDLLWRRVPIDWDTVGSQIHSYGISNIFYPYRKKQCMVCCVATVATSSLRLTSSISSHGLFSITNCLLVRSTASAAFRRVPAT